ncbi:MAG: TPM domain-containing protein [Ferruginibacter sp.]
MFPFSRKKKDFFTCEENDRVVAAIRSCENRTSGEMRVYVESKNLLVDPLERAAEVFNGLQMQQTHHRNAVLLYIAYKDKEVALYGDEGIHEQVGTSFWNTEVKHMLQYFKDNKLADGIEHCVRHVGEMLSEKFPFIPTEDKNELPDEIVFGK